MTEYVVERFNWQLVHGALIRRFGTVRVRAFPTFALADAHARRLEAEARALADPFAPVWVGDRRHGRDETANADRLPGLAAVTHFPEWAFTDWLMDHNVPLPAPAADGRRDWHHWWRTSFGGGTMRKWPPADRAAVWEALTKVRFYRVREHPAGPPVYAVLRVRWRGSQPEEAADSEGGDVVAVCASRRGAEAGAARRTAELLAGAAADARADQLHDMGDRPFPGQRFLDPDPPAAWRPRRPAGPSHRDADDVPHFDVCEVGTAPGVGAGGVLGLRAAFRFGFIDGVELADPVVPVRLFADQRAADEWAAGVEAAAQREWPVAWYGRLGWGRWDIADVPGEVADALDLLGLPPLPAPTRPDAGPVRDRFRLWWHEHGAEVTPEQNAALWELCDGRSPRFTLTLPVRVQ